MRLAEYAYGILHDSVGVNLRKYSLLLIGGNSDSRLNKGRDSEIAPTEISSRRELRFLTTIPKLLIVKG